MINEKTNAVTANENKTSTILNTILAIVFNASNTVTHIPNNNDDKIIAIATSITASILQI